MKKNTLFYPAVFTLICACFFSTVCAQNNAIFNGGNADGLAYGKIGSPGAGAPLPIELISFTGECENNTTILKWTTASEINNDYFTIERSASLDPSGGGWEVVGTVKGAGNSSTIRNYEFADNQLETLNLKPETIYYRLKQTDFDSKFEYFNIISVESCGESSTELTVFPNPSSGNFYVNVEGNAKDEILIVVRDVLGNEYYSKVVILTDDKEVIAVDAEGGKLAAGIYMVIASSNDKIYEKKIVIKK